MWYCFVIELHAYDFVKKRFCNKKGMLFVPGPVYIFNFFNLLIFRERGMEREGEKNIHLFFHLVMHSLVDSCMSSDQGSNQQPWCIGICSNQLSYPARTFLIYFCRLALNPLSHTNQGWTLLIYFWNANSFTITVICLYVNIVCIFVFSNKIPFFP